jgi:hypothetical protein
VGAVPRRDPWSPAGQHAAEPADLRAVREIIDDGGKLFEPLQGEVGITDAVDLADSTPSPESNCSW